MILAAIALAFVIILAILDSKHPIRWLPKSGNCYHVGFYDEIGNWVIIEECKNYLTMMRRCEKLNRQSVKITRGGICETCYWKKKG